MQSCMSRVRSLLSSRFSDGVLRTTR